MRNSKEEPPWPRFPYGVGFRGSGLEGSGESVSVGTKAVRGIVSGLPSASGANRGGGRVLPSGDNTNTRGGGDRFGVSRGCSQEDDSGSGDNEGLDEFFHYETP